MSNLKVSTEKEVIKRCKEIEKEMHLSEGALIEKHFERGCLVNQLDIVRGEGTVKRIAGEVGTSYVTLYFEISFAKYFQSNYRAMKQWMGQLEKPHWRQVCYGLLNAENNPTAHETTDDHKDHLIHIAENCLQRAEKALSKVNRYYKGDPEVEAVKTVLLPRIETMKQVAQQEVTYEKIRNAITVWFYPTIQDITSNTPKEYNFDIITDQIIRIFSNEIKTETQDRPH
ncbi:MAG: hypothetical protein V1850_02610 [Candidatus Bathyarchaeota archaeon]